MNPQTKRLGWVAVVICLGLAVPAQAGPGTWNVASGNWSVPGSWTEGAVPSGAGVTIGNDGVSNLDYGAPDITTLSIRRNSTLNILPGAGLTGTGANNWLVGDGGVAGFTTRLNQTGGTIVCGGDIYLGDDKWDYGEYRMSGGSLVLWDDLKCADDGGGLFVLSGNAALTVRGYISISNKAPDGDLLTGRFEISGGTLIQDGTASSGTDNHRITVGESDPGVLKLTGGLATINVTTYEQRSTGLFEVIMNGTGISTINASEGMTLAGDLAVSFAPGDAPAPGVYDLIVAQGTRTGTFTNVTLPPEVTLSYETGSSIVRLTVVPEPSAAVLAMGAAACLIPVWLVRRRKQAR